jgi:hypothetical protein
VLPVALVVAASLGAWLAQIGDVAASGAPLGQRMHAGLPVATDRAVSAQLVEDSELGTVLGEMPPASVDAITL